MMKNTLLVFFLCLITGLAQAQDSAVYFEHTLSWEQVKAKAKAEHKYIFMDCFATWCGPCRMMRNSVFPTPEAGAFFNQHFINVSLQCDTTQRDNDQVKAWYPVAQQMNKLYGIRVFPTFLFFDENGQLVHRVVGAYGSAKEFITVSEAALDTSRQYYNQLAQFNQGRRDTTFLLRTCMAAYDANDTKNGTALFNAYFNTQPANSWLYKDRLQLMAKFVRSSKSQAFTFFMHHDAAIDTVMHAPGAALSLLMGVIRREELQGKTPLAGPNPDWQAMANHIAGKYPLLDTPIRIAVADRRMEFNLARKDSAGYIQAAKDYAKTFGPGIPAAKWDELANRLAYYGKDSSTFLLALQWNQHALAQQQPPAATANYLQTTACLHYRLGQQDKAITEMEKAIALSDDMHRYSMTLMLQKIKKGESI
ncbi:Thioredoxin-related protein [Chitinophaga costaii]|uniref:Thioredoxin-related protein n=1 Tax=Chitinophaga costaii TaxID=1335309 RepID=A0A1C4FKJ3_9BACT|nr:thioredoxin family protein [Chitinophaga costaii]SCC56517.1 Thioredoxin-related protein [Chitinophaga costaii]